MMPMTANVGFLIAVVLGLTVAGTAAFLFSVPASTVPAGAAVPDGAEARLVVTRHIARADWYRRAGALLGAMVALEVGVIFYGRVGFSLGQTSLFGDILAMPMLGSLGGAVMAETYNLRRRYRSPRVATLVDRRDRYRRPTDARWFRWWAGASILAAVGSTVATGSLVLLVIAVALPVAVESTVRAIELRSRPVLDPELAAADDLIREWATRRVDRAGLGVAVLLTGWGILGAFDLPPWAGALLGLGSLLGSFLLWRSVARITR